MNAVESNQEMQVKKDVRDVCMPMGLVYEALVKVGRLKDGQEKEEEMNREKHFCKYHGRTMDHSIQGCPEFLTIVQEMMNKWEMEFCGRIEKQNVSVLLKEVPKPLTIFYRGGGQQARKKTPHVPTSKLVVKVPALFRYTSDKAVPWNYTSQEVVQESQAAAE